MCWEEERATHTHDPFLSFQVDQTSLREVWGQFISLSLLEFAEFEAELAIEYLDRAHVAVR